MKLLPRWGMLMLLLSSTALGFSQGARADALQAQAAYNAKDYAKCAALWTEQAKVSSESDARGDALYNAACCDALDAKPDLAFAAMEQSIAAVITDVTQLQADADLASLHDDPRWATLIASLQARIDAYEKTLRDPALRRELLELQAEDQASRAALIASHMKDKAALDRVAASDAKSTARMKDIVELKGWPGKKMVGVDGAHAAWLLVQHADRDVNFQKLCLEKMKQLVDRGEVAKRDYAYLVDRVAVAEKRPQTYGTQFNDKGEPQPIDDPDHVDQRRKKMGLPTMAVYKQQMLQTYAAQN